MNGSSLIQKAVGLGQFLFSKHNWNTLYTFDTHACALGFARPAWILCSHHSTPKLNVSKPLKVSEFRNIQISEATCFDTLLKHFWHTFDAHAIAICIARPATTRLCGQTTTNLHVFKLMHAGVIRDLLCGESAFFDTLLTHSWYTSDTRANAFGILLPAWALRNCKTKPKLHGFKLMHDGVIQDLLCWESVFLYILLTYCWYMFDTNAIAMCIARPASALR